MLLEWFDATKIGKKTIQTTLLYITINFFNVFSPKPLRIHLVVGSGYVELGRRC